MKKTTTMLAAMLLALSMMATAASAYTLDSATGTGFVGKGEVQTAFGWNNNVLQRNADSVNFRVQTVTETETSWECLNENNQRTQERERTTTTTTQGLLDSTARERNQVTGFNLLGYAGQPTTDSVSDGPAVNSCPSGPWTFVEGSTSTTEPEVLSGGVYAVFGGTSVLLP